MVIRNHHPRNRARSASSLLGAALGEGAKEMGSLHEANLVPRVLRGHWERGWQEAALWEALRRIVLGCFG